MTTKLDKTALDQLFIEARTRNGWTDQPVSDDLIQELYDLVKFAPTSANGSPARFVWVRSAKAKAKLAGLAMAANSAKILAAPVTVIIGHDLAFHEKFDTLFPARADMMKAMFSAPPMAEITAFRNGTLQGAYLILAARALGLDTGPMSGFDNAAVDEAFFAGTTIKSNFICCLGYGNDENLFPRNPRLSFEEACSFG
jgi:nitroreductase